MLKGNWSCDFWATSWENLVMPYTNNKGADQPTHRFCLISAFFVCCLDSIIPLFSISEISRFYLASVAAQAGLSLPWSQTPKTGFLVIRLIFITIPVWQVHVFILDPLYVAAKKKKKKKKIHGKINKLTRFQWRLLVHLFNLCLYQNYST